MAKTTVEISVKSEPGALLAFCAAMEREEQRNNGMSKDVHYTDNGATDILVRDLLRIARETPEGDALLKKAGVVEFIVGETYQSKVF